MFNSVRRNLVRSLVVVAAASTITFSPHQAAIADTGGYPYAGHNGPGSSATQSYWTDGNGNSYSPYRYVYRNCTDFVAWKLDTVNGWKATNSSGSTITMGNAASWGNWAASRNYAVDRTPKVGSVAWWNSNAGYGQWGHVAYVVSVSADGNTVGLQEYNWPTASGSFDGSYHTRSINKNVPSGYIHFKDLANNSSPGQPADPNHDGVADVIVVPFVGTGSGKTEVHALDGNGYNNWLFNLATSENGKAARNGYHLFVDFNSDHTNDLVEISMDPSGTTNVHVKAGPDFTTSIGDWATPIREQSAYTAKVSLADANRDGRVDLYVFTAGSNNRVNVHIVDGRNFTTSLGDFATPAGITVMDDYEILAQDYNRDGTPDMYLVSLQGNGSKADVHVLDGRGFQNWLGHWTTPFSASNVTHVRVMSSDKNRDGQPDLYWAVYNNGSGRIDVLVLDGRSFNNWIGMWQTAAAASSFAVADIALSG